MSDPECKTYPLSDLDKLRQALKEQNINVPPGNSGEIEGPAGVRISFDYDGSAKLTLCIVHKPMWVPASAVWTALEASLKPYET
jgi:hypothetical protein